MKIKGVLFDLDGTLVNTTPLILESFRHTFKQFGMPIPSDSELVAGFGLPMRTAVTAYMPDEMADEFCDAYRAYQRTRHDELIQGIDGVAETLSALKQSGIKMAVVTSKKRPAAIRDLGCYDLVEYFDTIIACCCNAPTSLPNGMCDASGLTLSRVDPSTRAFCFVKTLSMWSITAPPIAPPNDALTKACIDKDCAKCGNTGIRVNAVRKHAPRITHALPRRKSGRINAPFGRL